MGQVGTITAPQRVSLGENSRMLIGGVAGDINTGQMIRFIQAVVDVSIGELEATDNMSAGFTEATRSPRTLRVSGDAFWRVSDNPVQNPPNFQEGQLTARVLIWPDFDNAPNTVFKMNIGFFLGYSVTLAGTADIRFSFSLRNEGVFYTPSRPDPAGVFG